MFLVVTRTFPPEVGGMQNLMWGLAKSLAKIDLIKVFADYSENHEDFDNKVSFSVERVKGIKLLSCLLYTSPSPRDRTRSRMPSSA